MNLPITDKEILVKAKKLMDTDNFSKALELLLSISNKKHSNKFVEMHYLFLAYCYFNIKNYEYSLVSSDEVLKLNPKNEFASINKYLCYVELKKNKNALIEIFNFLKKNPAELYLITLEELLEDVKSGNIVDKEIIDAIKFLAKKNNV